MPRDQMRDPAGRDDRKLGVGGVARRVRGADGVPDGVAGGAPRVPGAGGKAPRPAGKGAVRVGRPRDVRNGGPEVNVCRELILAAIAEKPGNLPQLEARIKLGKTTIWRWVNHLHQAGEVHITSWARTSNGGPYKATYTAGPGDDAVCTIHKLTEAEKSRRYQARKKKLRKQLDDAKAVARASAAITAKTRDPWVAALFGPARAVA